MRIEDHQLVAESTDTIQLLSLPEEDYGSVIQPEIAVIHYAVTESLEATAAALRARDYVSAHLSIDGFRDEERSVMRVAQHVPFNRRAYHAGKSEYRGRSSVNGFSIGIEIANPGPLIQQPDGSLQTVYGRKWLGEAEEHEPSRGVPSNWTHWAKFTDEEVSLCATLCLLFKEQYGIKDVVGHWDVAPRRKFDPGPAFPMKWLHAIVFPGNDPSSGAAA